MPRRKVQVGKKSEGRIFMRSADFDKMNEPKPFATYNISNPNVLSFRDRRTGVPDRRVDERRGPQKGAVIGEIKGSKVIGMSEKEFDSLNEPKPNRVTSNKKLKELGVKKGTVAFKERRRQGSDRRK